MQTILANMVNPWPLDTDSPHEALLVLEPVSVQLREMEKISDP